MATGHIVRSDQSYFDDFLEEKIRKNPRTRYDIFIESPLRVNVDRDYRNTTSFMIPRLLRRFASEHPANVKIHNMDFRNQRTVIQQDQVKDETLHTVMNMYASPWLDFEDRFAKIDFFNDYKENPWMQPHLVRLLMLRTLLTHPRIRKQFEGVSPKLKTKIYTECIRLMDEAVESLSDSIREAGLSDYENLKKMPSTLTKILYKKIVESAMDIFCILMDLYSVARFFKKTTGTNVIVYAGAVHVWNYVTVLTALGGKIVYEYSPDNDHSPTIPLGKQILGKRRWIF